MYQNDDKVRLKLLQLMEQPRMCAQLIMNVFLDNPYKRRMALGLLEKQERTHQPGQPQGVMIRLFKDLWMNCTTFLDPQSRGRVRASCKTLNQYVLPCTLPPHYNTGGIPSKEIQHALGPYIHQIISFRPQYIYSLSTVVVQSTDELKWVRDHVHSKKSTLTNPVEFRVTAAMFDWGTGLNPKTEIDRVDWSSGDAKQLPLLFPNATQVRGDVYCQSLPSRTRSLMTGPFSVWDTDSLPSSLEVFQVKGSIDAHFAKEFKSLYSALERCKNLTVLSLFEHGYIHTMMQCIPNLTVVHGSDGWSAYLTNMCFTNCTHLKTVAIPFITIVSLPTVSLDDLTLVIEGNTPGWFDTKQEPLNLTRLTIYLDSRPTGPPPQVGRRQNSDFDPSDIREVLMKTSVSKWSIVTDRIFPCIQSVKYIHLHFVGTPLLDHDMNILAGIGDRYPGVQVVWNNRFQTDPIYPNSSFNVERYKPGPGVVQLSAEAPTVRERIQENTPRFDVLRLGKQKRAPNDIDDIFDDFSRSMYQEY